MADNMGEEKKSSSKKETVLELKVHMHCKACERSVFNTLRKCKGVKHVEVDMSIHRATVRGTAVNPEKVVKKLRKAGKKAEVISHSNIIEDKADEEEEEEEAKARKSDQEVVVVAEACEEYTSHSHNQMEVLETILVSPDHDFFHHKLAEDFSIFSDENPNSCAIV